MQQISLLTYGAEGDAFYYDHVKRSSHYDMPVKHEHPQYEIYYLLDGERYYFINDRAYYITKGDIVFINRNDLHKTSDIHGHGHERVLINFSDDFLQPSAIVDDDHMPNPFQWQSNVIKPAADERPVFDHIFQAISREIRLRKPAYLSYIKTLLTELILTASRHFMACPQDAVVQYKNTLHRRISAVAKYISDQYQNRLSLNDVSSQFYMSPYYLSRGFKQVTGFTFNEYINLTRIREAQKLLIETDEKIIDIAARTGYEQVTHFGRVFKKLTGNSPRTYRKKFRPQIRS